MKDIIKIKRIIFDLLFKRRKILILISLLIEYFKKKNLTKNEVKNLISNEELFKLKELVYKENNGLLTYCYKELLNLVVPKNELEKLAHSLISKFVIHSLTLMYLTKGTRAFSKNESKEFVVYDLDSVLTIYRTIIENYLTFFSIIFYPKTIEEIQFRFSIYSFVEAKHSFQNYSLLVIDKELLTINKINPFFEIDLDAELTKRRHQFEILGKEVFDNPLYSSLNTKQRSNLESKNPNWKIDGSWKNLADLASFNKSLFVNYYSMLSSSVHSGRISTEVNTTVNNLEEKYQVLLATVLNNVPLILSKFILELLEFFSNKNIIKDDVDLYNLILRKISIGVQTGMYKNDNKIKDYAMNYFQ